MPDTARRLDLLPLRARSRASALLRLRRNQKPRGMSLFCFCRRPWGGPQSGFCPQGSNCIHCATCAPLGGIYPQGVGARLPAICREPAAKPANAVCLIQRNVWTLIVPTLRVGMPGKTLCVHNDAECQLLRYHAERGNDQDTSPCRSVARPAICCAAAVKPCALAVSGEPHSPDLLPLRVRSRERSTDVGARLPAICREPAAKPENAVYLIQRGVWTLIVPTLRVGMPGKTLCVHSDAERQSLV